MVDTRQILGGLMLCLSTGCAALRLDESGGGAPATDREKPPKTLFAWQIGPEDQGKKAGGNGKEAETGGKKGTEFGKDRIENGRGNGTAKDDGAGGNGDAADEPDEITTDRPDFTEASSTVGRGRVQLEAGYTFSRHREGGITGAHSYPEALLRIGMFADWLELRFGQDFSNTRSVSGDGHARRISGREDLYLGVKLGLTEQRAYLPETALVLQATVPTGPARLTAGRTRPGLNLICGWDVNDFLSMGASTQGNSAMDEGGHAYLELAQSLTVGYSLTEKLGAYTEVFIIAPYGAIAPDSTPQPYFDGGFTYKLTPDLQFDVRAGVGLNHSAVDYFVGSGFAVRY